MSGSVLRSLAACHRRGCVRRDERLRHGIAGGALALQRAKVMPQRHVLGGSPVRVFGGNNPRGVGTSKGSGSAVDTKQENSQLTQGT